MGKNLTSLVLIAVVCSLLGCTKNFVKPRSVVLDEARAQGVALPSLEQERELFFAPIEEHERRLAELLQQRSQGPSRDSNYRLGAGDEVEINVFDVPELNVTTKLRDSGFLNLPLIGAVKAVGLSESELQEELEKRLASFVRQPNVSIFISNYGSQKVSVMGAVNKPGNYPLKKGDNSLVELLTRAGGVGNGAGSYLTFVPAESSGLLGNVTAEDRARFSLSSLNVDGETQAQGIEIALNRVFGTSGGIPIQMPVRGGDMLIVSEAGKVHVDGEVSKIGVYELGRRMSLLGALAAAGGITYGAKVDEVEIVRDVGTGDKSHLIVDLEKLARGEIQDIPLRDGDLVIVPSDSSRRLRQDTYEGITSIINFGVGGSVNLIP